MVTLWATDGAAAPDRDIHECRVVEDEAFSQRTDSQTLIISEFFPKLT